MIAVLFGATGAATPGAKAIAHSIMLGLHFGALTAICIYLFIKTPTKRSMYSPFMRWLPFVACVVGSILVILDLIRHFVLDQSVAPQHLRMFNDEGFLTPIGRAGVACTWTGIALLILSVGYFLDYQTKICNGVTRCYRYFFPQEKEAAPLVSKSKETA